MNTSDYYSRSDCRICGCVQLKKVLQLPDTPFGDEYVNDSQLQEQKCYPLTLVVCHDCGLLQILEVVSPVNLYLDYLYESKTSVELVNHFERYAQYLCEKWKVLPGSTVLEIGCNDGMLLMALAKQGMRVIGVDPAKRFTQSYKEKGIEFINDFFTAELSHEMIAEYGKVDVVIANNVLANVDDINSIFRAISDILTDNGLFLLESGWSLPLIKDYIIDNIHHEHYSYFGVKPMQRLLQQNNMLLIDVEHINTKGGSLRYVAKLSSNEIEPVRSSVTTTLMQEEAIGLYNGLCYATFENHLLHIKKSLLALLKDFKQKGKHIAGYGASVGTTTLLYYFGVTDYIDVLYDDNSIKIGLYSPQTHIPIKNSHEIYNDSPNIIVIFCWRYAANILVKHDNFLKNNGLFILPLSTLKIIDQTVKIEATQEDAI